MTPQPAAGIEVRPCHGLVEFDACVELQRRVWRGADLETVPLPLFVVAEEAGGQVLGAFAGSPEGEKLVGFTLALAGVRNGQPYLHSHMTAVEEGYRDRGVGRRLKLLQRQDALSRGIRLVEWTFDPLEIKNAYFNLMRLGAIVRRLIPNCYGITTSPLHGGLPTDRLMAEWWLASPRVERILSGDAAMTAANEAAGQRRVAAIRLPPAGATAHVHVPAAIGWMREHNPAQAASVQAEVRGGFEQWFARGYAATAVAIKEDGGNYLLEPWQDTLR